MPQARAVLKEVFGYDEFRPHQEEVVQALASGRDVLAVMPTSAGKSLCYQIPALMAEKGIAVVVSPLISLMADQVAALREAGVAAAFLNSSLSAADQTQVLHAVSRDLRLLYVAPERLGDPRLTEALRARGVSLIAVDEAHCISQWGCDFRPDYLQIRAFVDRLAPQPTPASPAGAAHAMQGGLASVPGTPEPALALGRLQQAKPPLGNGQPSLNSLGPAGPSAPLARQHTTAASETPLRPPIAALTATATDAVRRDIEQSLGLADPLRVVASFDRPNLAFSCVHPRSQRDRESWIVDYVRQRPQESGIVYAATRRQVDTLWEALRGAGVRAGRYHGGMDDADRAREQDDFVHDRTCCVVATNAFGMGIDKSDVSYVLHAALPQSLEAYYQEAGRAGRDGTQAQCVLLYREADLATARFLIEHSNEGATDPAAEEARLASAYARLEAMRRYAVREGCLRQAILEYFGEEAPDHCGPDQAPCGNCVEDMATGWHHAANEKNATGWHHGANEENATGRARAQGAGCHAANARAADGQGAGAPGANAHAASNAAGGTRAPGGQAADAQTASTRATAGQPGAGAAASAREDRSTDALKLLSCVARLQLEGRPQGRARVAAVLLGSQSADLRERGLDQLSTYGLLRHLTGAQAARLVNVLEERGLLATTGGRYPTLYVTEKGARFLRDPSPLWLRARAPQERKGAGRPSAQSFGRGLSAGDRGLFERLRQLRAELAGEKPAYVVASNATLEELARLRPRTREELLQVKGIGRAKADAYGDELLAAIASWKD